MKQKIYTLAIILFSGIATFGQTPNWIWSKQGGGSGYDVSNSISRTKSGYTYITGSFNGTATFGSGVNSVSLISYGAEDIFVAKYDTNGTFIWVKQAGGASGDAGSGITIDGSGNCIVTGTFSGLATFSPLSLTSAGQSDIFIAKYSPLGTLIWLNQAGGAFYEIVQSVATDASNNIFVTGYYTREATFGTGGNQVTLQAIQNNSNVFVAKYDVNGTLSWVRQAGSTFTTGASIGNGISTDNAGNCFVTGDFTISLTFNGTSTVLTSNNGVFIAKYDVNGTLSWGNLLASTPGQPVSGKCVSNDYAGNCYVGGYFAGANVEIGTNILSSTGYQDLFLAKYYNNGTFVWVRQVGGSNSNTDRVYATGISADSSGNSYIAGYFSGTANFGITTLSSISTTYDDIFVTKIDKNNNVIWVNQAGGSANNHANGIAATNSGECYVTGVFFDTTQFGNSIQLISSGSGDFYIAKIGICNLAQPIITPVGLSLQSSNAATYQWFLNGNIIIGDTTQAIIPTQSGNYTVLVSNAMGCSATSVPYNYIYVGISVVEIENLISIFPNPTSSNFTILLPMENSEIIVTDIHGQQIIKKQATQKTMSLQLDKNGIYIVYIRTNQGTTTRKLIVNR